MRDARLRPGITSSSLSAYRPLSYQHVLVDRGDAALAAKPHCYAELVAQDIERLGHAGATIGTEPIDIGAADHARLGAERERAHHVLAGADARVEHHFDLGADGIDNPRQHRDR